MFRVFRKPIAIEDEREIYVASFKSEEEADNFLEKETDFGHGYYCRGDYKVVKDPD